jgi:hypothetical protein
MAVLMTIIDRGGSGFLGIGRTIGLRFPAKYELGR